MADLIDRILRLLPSRGPLASIVFQRAALAVIVVGSVAFPLVVQTPPIDLQVGQPAPRTIRANRTVQFIDEAATEGAREQASAAVEPVMRFDSEAAPSAREDVGGFFEVAIATKATAVDATATAQLLEKRFGQFSAATMRTAAGMEITDLRAAQGSAEQLVTTLLSRRVPVSEMAGVSEQMSESVDRLAFPAPVQELIRTVLGEALRPTLVVDEDATVSARGVASDEVDAVVIVKQAGENIVQEGVIVTSDDLEIIRRLGLLEQSGSVGSLAALVAVAAMIIASVGAYLWRYDRPVWDSPKHLVIMATLFVGMVWTTRIVSWWRPEIPIYLMPVPLAAMLATLLLSAREGMLVAVATVLGAVLLGFASGASVVAALVWSLAGVVVVSFMTDRRKLFLVGAALVATGAALGFIATLASGVQASDAADAALWGSIGGTVAAILGYGLLPFFEHAFGVTTDVRLLELASPTQPLLRRLMVEAPGTYNHSVMAGNLAEAAAEAIGANPLLARVGAYYHDVGKLKRPGFFVENQAGGENPHDSTSPSMSALIITSHVREGLELASASKLPSEITDIIRQHHGTSLVSYFYNKAAEGDCPVYEADFRYDGVRPQSPESALVMLADSCEAAARTVRKPTPPRVEATVRGVIDGKVADGQLDDARLTLADIESVIKVYSRMLSAVYHPRVEYPPNCVRRAAHAHRDDEPPRS